VTAGFVLVQQQAILLGKEVFGAEAVHDPDARVMQAAPVASMQLAWE